MEIGVAGRGPVYAVGPAGQIGLIGAAAVIDWWVGADDRWHVASTESAVRQELGEDDTTVETRLRIPSGDAIHRVTSMPDGSHAVVRIEIENASPVPVAVAVVVRATGAISIDDDTVLVDDRPVLRASRSVVRVLVSDADDGLRQGVIDGRAVSPRELDGAVSGTTVAVVFPLPHTAVLRCVVGLDGADGLSKPSDLPPNDAVARGWGLHLDRASVSVPDGRVTRVAAAARRHLLVGSGRDPGDAYWRTGVEPWVPPVAAAALDLWGHDVESRELLLAATGTDDLAAHAARGVAEAGALLWAWAERLERRREPELEAALVSWIEEAAIGLLGRTRTGRFRRGRPAADDAWRAVGLAAAGSLLSRSGNETLGPDIVDALPQIIADVSPDPAAVATILGGRRLGVDQAGRMENLLAGLVGSAATLSSIAGGAAPTGALALEGRSQHPMASALYLVALRRALVDEPGGAGGVVALLSSPEADWMGAPMEGHDLPVTGGLVSFGVRWHGDRPALLWDLRAALTESGVSSPGLDAAWHDQRGVSSPGLDAAWHDQRSAGDALLGPTTGLAHGEGPSSPEVRRGETIDADDAPDSFG